MSIHFISGKPGGGKTLYSVKLIVEELLYGTRPIFTNVPLDVGRLNEYLQQQYPKKAIDVVGRVRLLNEDETASFWTYRAGGVRVRQLTKAEWAAGGRPDYTHVSDGGVMYVIDEVHNYFNARQWALTGQDVLFYLSQHRHLGDTVVCITQAVGNVDRQFRSVAQDFTYLRNMVKEKQGLFRMPGIFVRRTYGSPPTDTSVPMETGTFRLDVSGLASCYSTVAGVGIHERAGSADVGERRKGIHWAWFFVGVGLLAWFLFGMLPGLIAKQFDTNPMTLGSGPVVKPAGGPVVLPPGPVPVAPPPPVVLGPGSVGLVPPARPTEPELYLVGVVTLGGGRVYLSDGRCIEASDPRLTEAGKDYVVFEGRKLVWRPH